MKKIKIVIGLVIVFLLLCGQQRCEKPIINGNGNTEVDHFNPRSSDGLVVDADSETLVTEIFQGEEFELDFMIKNKGTYNVLSAQVDIGGLPLSKFSVYPDTKRIHGLEGVSRMNKDPTPEYVRFNVVSLEDQISWKDVKEKREDYFVKLTFPYETKVTHDICIGDKRNTLTKEQCTPTLEESIGASGAPVAISDMHVTQRINGPDVDLLVYFELENVGKGEIISDIVIEEVLIGLDKMKCSPKEVPLSKVKTQMKKKGAVFGCELTVENSASPTVRPMLVRFSYTYQVLEKSAGMIPLHIVVKKRPDFG